MLEGINNETVLEIAQGWSLFRRETKESALDYLFNVDNGAMFRLNGVGHDVLSMIDGNNSVGQIIECMKSEYEMDEELDPQTITQFLADLYGKGAFITKSGE